MKHALIAITAVLMLSACRPNKTTATSAAQGTSATPSSKTSPRRTSPDGKMAVPSKGSAQSAVPIEKDRGVDPKKSSLNVRIRQ